MKPFLLSLMLVFLLSTSVQPAHAYKRFFLTDEGYRCEMTYTDELAKAVCRHPAGPYKYWYVMYFEFNHDADRVFIDTYYPLDNPYYMEVSRRDMTRATFLDVYGR